MATRARAGRARAARLIALAAALSLAPAPQGVAAAKDKVRHCDAFYQIDDGLGVRRIGAFRTQGVHRRANQARRRARDAAFRCAEAHLLRARDGLRARPTICGPAHGVVEYPADFDPVSAARRMLCQGTSGRRDAIYRLRVSGDRGCGRKNGVSVSFPLSGREVFQC